MKFLPFKKKAPASPEQDFGDAPGFTEPKGGGKPPPSRLGRRLKIASLILAALVTLVQIGGILLRDTLEGRIPQVRSEPLLTAIAAAAPKAHEETHFGGRGFGVAEVEIGTPPEGHSKPAGHAQPEGHAPAESHATSAGHAAVDRPGGSEAHRGAQSESHGKTLPDKSGHLAAPPPPHASTPEHSAKIEHPAATESVKAPEKAKSKLKPLAKGDSGKPPPPRKAPSLAQATAAAHPEPAKTAERQPARAAKESEPSTLHEERPPATSVTAAKATGREKFQADPKGGYAVAVGAFNSPRLAQLMEQRLDELGFPHLRIATTKEADGYTLTLSAESDAVLQNARKAVLDNGYKLEKTPEGFSARFFTEEEAGKAKAIAERSGALATVKKASGQMPLWRIMVGPTTAQNAAKAQEVLKAEGIDCVTVRYKQ